MMRAGWQWSGSERNKKLIFRGVYLVSNRQIVGAISFLLWIEFMHACGNVIIGFSLCPTFSTLLPLIFVEEFWTSIFEECNNLNSDHYIYLGLYLLVVEHIKTIFYFTLLFVACSNTQHDYEKTIAVFWE